MVFAIDITRIILKNDEFKQVDILIPKTEWLFNHDWTHTSKGYLSVKHHIIGHYIRWLIRTYFADTFSCFANLDRTTVEYQKVTLYSFIKGFKNYRVINSEWYK